MGDFNVTAITDVKSKNEFYRRIWSDIKTFESMLNNHLIESRSDKIGVEQEICIINSEMNPASNALEILKNINDNSYTNELALFNLEINSKPYLLEKECFSEIENELKILLDKGEHVANQFNTHLFLTGILPTLKFRDLNFNNMTPEPRYRALSEALLNLRGSNFEVYLQGVDDLSLNLETVLFEACNTSFQTHLQIAPEEFVDMHNWAQMIAGPILSMASNSPLLFGRELWAETRIALFKQSLDTRGKNLHTRKKSSRVYFGDDWIYKSAAELWIKDVARFPLILQATGGYANIQDGTMSRLKNVRLHNGTTYTWNRLCYGIADNIPHIRIECRYLPAGPSLVDEIANLVFWIGVMKGQPESLKKFYLNTDFRIAKDNFIRAARTGIHTVFHWFGKNYSASELVLKVLLPISRSGLESCNVSTQDIDKYLGIIESRAITEQNGSEFMVNRFRKLLKKCNEIRSLERVVRESLDFQKANIPVHEWKESEIPRILKRPMLVEDIMNTNIYTISPDLEVETALDVLKFKNVHHLPVEWHNGKLVGVITEELCENAPKDSLISEVMSTKLQILSPSDTIESAKDIMHKNNFTYCLVMDGTNLCGILTNKDF